MAQRSDDKTKGINKITFAKYYELPGIICDRLFAVFDKNKNDYLDLLEFIEGMSCLFSENYEKLAKFIFDFYDFDKDGKISKEDIRVVLSYIPLKTKKYSQMKLKFEMEGDFKDRIESQDELHTLLEKCFLKCDSLDIAKFSSVIENVNSDIFLFILIFLMEKRPFSKKTLNEFEGVKDKTNNRLGLNMNKTPVLMGKTLIASPNLQSKFTPSNTISKSPSMAKRNTLNLNSAVSESKNLFFKLSGKPEEPKNVLMKLAGKSGFQTSQDPIDETDENVSIKNIPVNRKQRNNLKVLETNTDNQQVQMKKSIEYTDLPITPAIKYGTNDSQPDKTNKVGIIIHDADEADNSDDDDKTELRFEGFLFKITQSKKLKKLWFKLIFKDLYYFKTQGDTTHKGMHNLSGVFVKEEQAISYDGTPLWCFSVIYPKKARHYYVDNETDYNNWMKNIRKATGYANLNDIYDVKVFILINL